MQTLIIKDLAITEELDSKTMAAVHGGTGYAYCPTNPVYYEPSYWGSMVDPSKGNLTFNASQALGQSQNTTVNNGNNVAFSSGITANVNPTQNGTNNISFG